jgi:hypothetical protein
MVDEVVNTSDVTVEKPASLETARIENFEGIGEITIGVGSNWYIIAISLCILNHPQVNKFLLAQQLNLSDRLTKTKIFPREGMALPDGEVYTELTTNDKKEG